MEIRKKWKLKLMLKCSKQTLYNDFYLLKLNIYT